MDLDDAYDVYDMDDGARLSRDCLARCAPGAPALCDVEWCECEHHLPAWPNVDPDRARALDDRPAETLASLARDVEAENRPQYERLRRERFGLHGWPRRGAA